MNANQQRGRGFSNRGGRRPYNNRRSENNNDRGQNNYQRRYQNNHDTENGENRRPNNNDNYQRRYQNNHDTENGENRRPNNNDNYQRRYQNNHDTENGQHRRPNNNDNQNKGWSRKMGFKMVQDLLDNDDLEDVVFILSNEKKGFKELLENNKLTPDLIVLTVKLLRKICDCSFHNSKTQLLTSVISSGFGQTLILFITTLSIQDAKDKRMNKYFWNDTDDFWMSIICISKTFNSLLPTTSCEINVKLLKALKFNLPDIEISHTIHVSDSIKNEINNLCEVAEKTVKEVERKQEVKSLGYIDTEEDMEPPEDFREISVYPSAFEITSNQQVFLRRNVVRGAYQDVNHYLDVQYRLLREDFVVPLRTGICKYMENNKSKLENIKIYKNVKFVNMETITTVSEQKCYRLQYDFSNKKQSFQYENSKRFMVGSLLCFTHDKFKSVLFAKIAQRDLKDLEKGQVIVGFDPDVFLPGNLYDLSFLLVESKVFFEPYYQILTVLKQMSTDNFPMERYIIEVATDTRPPDYLLKIDPVYLTIENTRFWPLAWGDKKFYGLNEAQSEAFQAALTKELAIIQGPPGTGKTFLGLKICRTLLENHHAWYKNTPILVVCLTNHALDQFLEGLIPTTRNLIRVGGQSKNETLAAFNIRNRMKNQSSNPAIHQKRLQVKHYMTDIGSINNYLNEIDKYTSVVDFRVFSQIVDDFKGSWFEIATNDQIITWLLGGGQDIAGNRRNAAPNTRPATVEEDGPLERENEENLGENEMEYEDFQDVEVAPFKELISIKVLSEKIIILQKEFDALREDDQMSNWERENEEDKMEIEMNKIENDLNILKIRLEEGKNVGNNDRRRPDFVNMENPNRMPPDLRWKLYFHWLSLYENNLRQQKEILVKEFTKVNSVFNEMREMENTQTMKSALVIGMTTTGAARHQSSLQALKSPIVVVEEAAEVLEAHIIAALTKHCKHLILIGDHQQLKPSTADFKIETKFLLGVSLFERMVTNNIQCHTLNIQHRMRPEIANLVRPTIYPILHDHESVLERGHINGVENDLFFIDHTVEEKLCNDNSKKNIHEAKFMIQFAKHLILNGYKPEQIIILAAYLGQMFEMQRERGIHRALLQDVRIAVLDNYQGEESDIVLLSLVRSNKEGKIGFLKIENRVCVALSRARNGFYIMGNMKQLCDNSDIWPKIRETFERQNALGPHLTLRCQIHRHRINNVSTAEDFRKLPEGGCDLLCECPLNCGHVCTRICHIEDREHVHYDCREKCEKLLCDNPKHECRKYCYQECGPCYYPVERHLNCGHKVKIACHLDPATYDCTILVDTTLPCGHETKKPCYIDHEKFECPLPCDTRVEPCGHACTKKCHFKYDPDHLTYMCRKPCERNRAGCTAIEPHICPNECFQDCVECAVSVRKKRTDCGHMYDIACNANPDDIVCKRPCKKILACGHLCKQICCDPCRECEVMVEKIVPSCQHKIKIECCKSPNRIYCKGKCPRVLPCGHVCDKQCNQECTTECKVIVDCSIFSPCGHTIKKIYCHVRQNYTKELLFENCTEKCNAELTCKHACAGSCGKCFQGRLHQRCQEKCGVPLVCNHECPIPCREACRPCTRPCEYRCKHSKCKKKCGDPCTMCQEKCPRSCEHQTCKRKCGQMCEIDPCTKPCPKQLKCEHKCVGFCGDPCPNLCRICNKEELLDIFFGTEEEEDARFVLMQDCNHVLESTGMESWLEQKTDENEKIEIKPAVCPKCKTVIKKTYRYSNYVKQSMDDLRRVKIRYHGDPKELEATKNILNNELIVLKSYNFGNKALIDVLIKLSQRLGDIKGNRRQNTNKMDLDSIRMTKELLTRIVEPLKNEKLSLANLPLSNKHVSFIINFLSKKIDCITQQETDDIILEIDRLNRWIQLERINYKPHLQNSDVKIKVDGIVALLEAQCRYDTRQDLAVKEKLEDLIKFTASPIKITDEEKKEIVRAIGLSSGHWYKCPNGHPYAIGECGGAMQMSRCPDCGVAIGGSNHRLIANNALASEMDGARHAAWSELANLDNFQLNI